jgi:ferredoxin-NADP reductase/DMSO/TMAO reductase YedYZ heme-binding membrane subunit
MTDAALERLRRQARVHPDRALVRRLVLVNGAVPITLLAYDAWQRQLGANGTKFAIHTTGMLALVFLMLSLVVTPLKRLTGWNEVVAARRALGLYGFFYLVVHFSIFFVLDREASVSSTVTEILTRRYLQIGTIALLLLIPLAVTSTDAMITRLGPRRWKRLHRLTYLTTSLGALHYYLQVKSDVRQPLAFAGVLAGLLGFRVVVHYADRSRRMMAKAAATAARKIWSGELRVSRTTDETPDVRTFRLVAPAGGPLPFTHRPGQYLNIALVIDGQRVNRSYTIASAPTHANYCEITVKKAAVGYASTHLHDVLREGAMVRITAPAGRFVFDGDGPPASSAGTREGPGSREEKAGSEHVLLVAGGVGITPLMAMVRTLTDRQWTGRIDLVFSVKTAADFVFRKELEELASRFPNLHLCVTATREPKESAWPGERGQITRELLLRVTPELRSVPIYLCGPEPMMEALTSLLVTLGAPAASIHVEAFVSPPRAPALEDDARAEQSAEADQSPARASAPTGEPVMVEFAGSGVSTEVADGQTLLEAAEENGVEIPFDCRSGICGQCKTKLLQGRVVMDVQDALTADDRKKRLVLACQARPVNDVIIDA